MIALGALKNLLNSEKAFAGGVLIICATVLVAVGDMSISDWQDYTKWIFGIYVFGKTTQGAVASVVGKASSPSSSSSSVSVSTKKPAAKKTLAAEPAEVEVVVADTFVAETPDPITKVEKKKKS